MSTRQMHRELELTFDMFWTFVELNNEMEGEFR